MPGKDATVSAEKQPKILETYGSAPNIHNKHRALTEEEKIAWDKVKATGEQENR
jgi:hypothetical protein